MGHVWGLTLDMALQDRAAAARSPVPMLRPTRLLALGGLVLIALFYWKPLRTYEHTRGVLDRRQADVSRLQQQQRTLEHQLATVGTGDGLIREARKLGLVKPGEQLFIVKGIAAWRKRH